MRDVVCYLAALAAGGAMAVGQHLLLAPLTERGALARFGVRCIVACSGTTTFGAVLFGICRVPLDRDSHVPGSGGEIVAISLAVGFLYALVWPVAHWFRRY